MEAVFFLARPEDAIAVASSDHLLPDPVGDPLRLSDPSPLVGLAGILGVGGRVDPLRDATCRSFPVWDLGPGILKRLSTLAEDEIDGLAQEWHEQNENRLDADLYELAMCLTDLREASRECECEQHLFALLEERAL